LRIQTHQTDRPRVPLHHHFECELDRPCYLPSSVVARLTATRSCAPPGPYLGDVGLAELLDADMRVLAAGRR